MPASQLCIPACSCACSSSKQLLLVSVFQPSQLLWWPLAGPGSLAKLFKADADVTNFYHQPTHAPGRVQTGSILAKPAAASFAKESGLPLLLVAAHAWMLLRSAAGVGLPGSYTPMCSNDHSSLTPHFADHSALHTSIGTKHEQADAAGVDVMETQAEQQQTSNPVAAAVACRQPVQRQLPAASHQQLRPWVVLWDWRSHASVHNSFSSASQPVQYPAHGSSLGQHTHNHLLHAGYAHRHADSAVSEVHNV